MTISRHARTVIVAAALAAGAVAGVTGAQSTQPGAVPRSLYEAVRENLAHADRVSYLYAFKERRTDIHTNPFGRIGTGGTRLYEVYPSPVRQLTYRRLIEEEGQPLSPPALAEQDRQYRARVAEVQRGLANQASSARERREAESARAQERRSRRIDDIVETFDFRLEGRSVHEGVPAIVVSFAPRPGAKPVTREGRTAQSFRGSVWIHEAASEVMRVEAESISSISFGFGIVVRVARGARATMTRRPVEGGVWMPTEMTLDGRGRAALFRSLVLDFSVTWYDYRRLSGESVTPFLDGAAQR
jgi:hypothetical protein